MASIDGLGSGLDTTSIVSQLMAIERQPQDRLVQQRLSVLSAGTAWNQIGVGLTALKTAADKIVKSGALGAATGTSSTPTTATVTVSSGASPGSHSLSVQALATAGSTSRTVASASTVVGAGTLLATRGTASVGISGVAVDGAASPPTANGTYAVSVAVGADGTTAEVTVGATKQTVAMSAGSFTVGGLSFDTAGLKSGKAEVTLARTTSPTATVADLAAQLNAAGGVASAAVVTTTDAQGATSTQLLVSSTATGSDGAVTTTTSGLAGLGSETSVRGAKDASFTLDGLAGITRSSNSISDLLPGVKIDLVAAGTAETTINVAKDPTSAATSVKDVVTALNTVLSTISTNSKYDVASKKSAPLTGDSIARGLTSRLQNAVSSSGIGAQTTLGALGISLQRDGSYAFDDAAFSKALTKDPAATTALLTTLTTGLSDLAKSATATGGETRRGSQSATDQAAGMQRQIDSMGTRLALAQARMTKQFNDLDTALGSLKSQGSWLSSQLSSL